MARGTTLQRADRDPKIAAAYAGNARTIDLACEYGLTPRRIAQIAAEQGVALKPAHGVRVIPTADRLHYRKLRDCVGVVAARQHMGLPL